MQASHQISPKQSKYPFQFPQNNQSPPSNSPKTIQAPLQIYFKTIQASFRFPLKQSKPFICFPPQNPSTHSNFLKYNPNTFPLTPNNPSTPSDFLKTIQTPLLIFKTICKVIIRNYHQLFCNVPINLIHSISTVILSLIKVRCPIELDIVLSVWHT